MECRHDIFPSWNREVFLNDLLFIAWILIGWQDVFCQMEARPGAPTAQFPPRAADPGGKVLVVTHGVSQKTCFVAACENPDFGPVGKWPWHDGRGVGIEVKREGMVELEQCLGWSSLEPKRLGAGEAADVVGPLIMPVSQWPGISGPDDPGCRREEWTTFSSFDVAAGIHVG